MSTAKDSVKREPEVPVVDEIDEKVAAMRREEHKIAKHYVSVVIQRVQVHCEQDGGYRVGQVAHQVKRAHDQHKRRDVALRRAALGPAS